MSPSQQFKLGVFLAEEPEKLPGPGVVVMKLWYPEEERDLPAVQILVKTTLHKNFYLVEDTCLLDPTSIALPSPTKRMVYRLAAAEQTAATIIMGALRHLMIKTHQQATPFDTFEW